MSAESSMVKIARIDRGLPKLFGSFAQRTREPIKLRSKRWSLFHYRC